MSESTDSVNAISLFNYTLPEKAQDIFTVLKNVAGWHNVSHARNFIKYLFRTGKEQPNDKTALNQIYYKGAFYSANGPTDKMAQKMQKVFLGHYGKEENVPVYLNEMIYVQPVAGEDVDVERIMDALKHWLCEQGYPYNDEDLYVFHLDQDDGFNNVHIHRVYHRQQPSLFKYSIKHDVLKGATKINLKNDAVNDMINTSATHIDEHQTAMAHVAEDIILLNHGGDEPDIITVAIELLPKVDWTQVNEFVANVELADIEYRLYGEGYSAVLFQDGVCLNAEQFFPNDSESRPLWIGTYNVYDYLAVTYVM